MSPEHIPGVSINQEQLKPRLELPTGVPVFLGRVQGPPLSLPLQWLTHPEQLATVCKDVQPSPELTVAVRGFFENGGKQCGVVLLDDAHTLEQGLQCLHDEDEFDLLCAPGLPPTGEDLLSLHQDLIRFCAQRGDCIALLDPPSGLNKFTLNEYLKQLRQVALDFSHGVLYAPRIRVALDGKFQPACGHIAGVYARVAQSPDFFKAPANEVLTGVVEVETHSISVQTLHENNVNGLRALPGRGIRVMGARTLSPEHPWCYVSVKRLFLTLRRQLMRELAWTAFEPNELRLWLRVHREVSTLLESFFQRGALQGNTPEEAFYVKCDAENNPPEVRERGELVIEVGLAPSTPREFIVLHLVQHEGGRIETTET